MFTKFHIKNFRTHVDTVINPKDLTLIIGSNNSGKSNLLEALSFFSELVKRSLPESEDKEICRVDYSNHKHKLAQNDNPISFTCEWVRNEVIINYKIDILKIRTNVICREFIEIKDKTKSEPLYFNNDIEQENHSLSLLTKILNEQINNRLKVIVKGLRSSLCSLSYYNFQPAYLKGEINTIYKGNAGWQNIPKRDFSKKGEYIEIGEEIGREGGGFLALIKYVKEYEQTVYNKFVAFLRRFESNFLGIDDEDQNVVKWQFDIGSSTFPSFESHEISDGLIKAAAIALLCAMDNPPSVIMIEEVENGINQKNLSEFLKWLESASENGKRTQFILTSHSPSVIREFSDKLDCVYNVHLKRKKGYVSEVTNLNEALKPLVRFGSIKEDAAFEKDGIVHIRPHALTELFYNGILAEL